MEYLEDRASGKPRRALAEWKEDRRVRARHSADGLPDREKQISGYQRLRREARRPHRAAGSRRRGLFQQYQDSGLVTLGAGMTGKESLDRRDFLKKASVAGLGALAASRSPGPLFAFAGSPAEKMNVAVMGLNGRRMVPARAFARSANTRVGYLCDVDSNVLARALAEISPLQTPPPKAVSDFRHVLDDKSV